MSRYRIEPLQASHALETFDCGDEALNRFLIRFALANQRARASRTYVALAGDVVVGFHTLVVGEVSPEQAPERIRKGLARHSIPLMVLARLAVAVDHQGQGLGAALLKDAIGRTLAAANIAGIRALAVHAKDERARGFYEHFGFRPSPSDPLHLFVLNNVLLQSPAGCPDGNLTGWDRAASRHLPIIGQSRFPGPLLHQLETRNTGPAPAMSLEFAPRLNLITGDNSLGKSFLLDVAWYCLTRRWPQELNQKLSGGSMAQPIMKKEPAEIRFTVDGEIDANQAKSYSCIFNLEEEAWIGKAGRPVNSGLVIYAMADGAFAVWDPARNAWKRKGSEDTPEKTKAYVFSSREVWKGLPNPQSDLGNLCNGLVHDWASWQREDGEAFAQLKSVLTELSPDSEMPMVPGDLMRISRQDSRDYPTLKSPSGQMVPLVHWSSGVKRILALAYLLVWAWQEHCKASEFLGKPPTKQMIFLIDEVEAHLHPTWQRRVVRSLMEVVQSLHKQTSVQLMLVTHSPLVMASVEPIYDPNQDSWWDFDWSIKSRQVQISRRPFDRLGDANSWLRSDAFDQNDTGSIERELVLRRARQVISAGKEAKPEEVAAMHTELRSVLGSADIFWNRWRFACAQSGWQL